MPMPSVARAHSKLYQVTISRMHSSAAHGVLARFCTNNFDILSGYNFLHSYYIYLCWYGCILWIFLHTPVARCSRRLLAAIFINSMVLKLCFWLSLACILTLDAHVSRFLIWRFKHRLLFDKRTYSISISSYSYFFIDLSIFSLSI